MRNTSVDLLTPRQMAHESGWSVKSIRKLLAERRIRHLRRSNRYLIPETRSMSFWMPTWWNQNYWKMRRSPMDQKDPCYDQPHANP